jgi:hypothetical protein
LDGRTRESSAPSDFAETNVCFIATARYANFCFRASISA